MRRSVSIFLILLAILAAACSQKKYICPPDGTEISIETMSDGPAQVEIRGRMVWMDQIVHGSICEGSWRGTVYVACDVQVAAWVEQPTFLDGCSLNIDDGTVVYVADHNNEAYYKGCSCHYTDGLLP